MFIPRTYKPAGAKWPWYTLLTLEFPLTVALLALFGIAAPNLYRTKLWQDGADNGFNSDPSTALYAAANYRPYSTPKPWSQFITNYNVVIAVLSMFIMLAKAIMYIVHVFPPLLSLITHLALTALYAVSINYQSGPDTTDPKQPQHGAPWYITKSCSVTKHPSNMGYCQQAKAAFAATVVMMCVFALHSIYAAISCVPNASQRAAHRTKCEERAALEIDESELKTPEGAFKVPQTPSSPSGLSPMTPRTLAFNRLDGTTTATRSASQSKGARPTDLPLRNHFSSPQPPRSASPISASPTSAMPLRSPDFGTRSPMRAQFEKAEGEMTSLGAALGGEREGTPNMYFPPPPTKAKGKGKGK